MVVDSDKILFFFVAGGSAEFGIPPMRKMAEDFKSIINQQNLPQERDAYNEIVKMLRDDMGPDVDIEAKRYYNLWKKTFKGSLENLVR